MNSVLKIAAVSLLASSAATAALAHATFANGEVKAEGYVAAVLQVPHGCDGKATNEVQVKLPEGFISAKPMPKAGWELEVMTSDYKKSYDNHGKAITSGPVEIRWKNGDLPDGFYDTFTIYGKVSGIEAGSDLPFLTTQLCGTDGKVAWVDVAPAGTDPHSLKSPAPVLKIAAASNAHDAHAGHGQAAAADAHAGHGQAAADAHAGHGDHGTAAAPGDTAAAKIGDVELTGGFTKAMLPGQPVGGGFVTIHNKGAADDRLVSAKSPSAGRVELHEMVMQSDVMKMRQLNDGIAVPAGATVELKPGGLHLMFMDVRTPFVEGETVDLKLTFEKAGTVDLVLPIGPARGK